jgi:hypothetical protein
VFTLLEMARRRRCPSFDILRGVSKILNATGKRRDRLIRMLWKFLYSIPFCLTAVYLLFVDEYEIREGQKIQACPSTTASQAPVCALSGGGMYGYLVAAKFLHDGGCDDHLFSTVSAGGLAALLYKQGLATRDVMKSIEGRDASLMLQPSTWESVYRGVYDFRSLTAALLYASAIEGSPSPSASDFPDIVTFSAQTDEVDLFKSELGVCCGNECFVRHLNRKWSSLENRRVRSWSMWGVLTSADYYLYTTVKCAEYSAFRDFLPARLARTSAALFTKHQIIYREDHWNWFAADGGAYDVTGIVAAVNLTKTSNVKSLITSSQDLDLVVLPLFGHARSSECFAHRSIQVFRPVSTERLGNATRTLRRDGYAELNATALDGRHIRLQVWYASAFIPFDSDADRIYDTVFPRA